MTSNLTATPIREFEVRWVDTQYRPGYGRIRPIHGHYEFVELPPDVEKPEVDITQFFVTHRGEKAFAHVVTPEEIAEEKKWSAL